MWIIILIIVIAVMYAVLKTKSNSSAGKGTNNPVSEDAPCRQNITSERILNDPNFKRNVEYFRPHWRWMTLAGGTDPWLLPQISFGDDGTIYMTKHGYDLWTNNWKAYKATTDPEKSKKALERFAKDLFGEYAGKLKISTEYIADHLIVFEDSSASSSDFTVTFSFPGNLTTPEERYLFRRELANTSIFDVES